MNTYSIVCAYCGSNFTTASNPAIQLKADYSLESRKDLSWTRCSSCNRVNIISMSEGRLAASRSHPSNCYVPRYCQTHEISYFDPDGKCPYCNQEGMNR